MIATFSVPPLSDANSCGAPLPTRMSKSVRRTTVLPFVRESPPLCVTVAALRSSAARPPVIGKLAVVPLERRRADDARRDALARERLQHRRVDRQRGRALGEQLGLRRLGLHADLAERDPVLERRDAERGVERPRGGAG